MDLRFLSKFFVRESFSGSIRWVSFCHRENMYPSHSSSVLSSLSVTSQRLSGLIVVGTTRFGW